MFACGSQLLFFKYFCSSKAYIHTHLCEVSVRLSQKYYNVFVKDFLWSFSEFDRLFGRQLREKLHTRELRPNLHICCWTGKFWAHPGGYGWHGKSRCWFAASGSIKLCGNKDKNSDSYEWMRCVPLHDADFVECKSTWPRFIFYPMLSLERLTWSIWIKLAVQLEIEVKGSHFTVSRTRQNYTSIDSRLWAWWTSGIHGGRYARGPIITVE